MDNRHEVLAQILCLANCLSRELGALNAQHSQTSISRVNAQILGYLAAHEGQDVFQRDIEEAFAIRRSTVSKVVQLMEQKELIARKAVAHDARLKRLTLTDKARQIHASAAPDYAAFEARATSALTDGEIETLISLLGKIACAPTLESNEENI